MHGYNFVNFRKLMEMLLNCIATGDPVTKSTLSAPDLDYSTRPSADVDGLQILRALLISMIFTSHS